MRIKYNGHILTKAGLVGSAAFTGGSPGPEPVPTLPDYTIRLKYEDGVTPSFRSGSTAVQVSESPNIWDFTMIQTNWLVMFQNHTSLLEVIAANISSVDSLDRAFAGCSKLEKISYIDARSVTNFYNTFSNCTSLTTINSLNTASATNMSGMFTRCTSLVEMPDLNTSLVTTMLQMFYNCSSLSEIKLLNTDSLTNMIMMFSACKNVTKGALAFYQQVSTQPTPPRSHSNSFYQCGSNTETGTAELAQIPTSWGGTMQ